MLFLDSLYMFTACFLLKIGREAPADKRKKPYVRKTWAYDNKPYVIAFLRRHYPDQVRGTGRHCVSSQPACASAPWIVPEYSRGGRVCQGPCSAWHGNQFCGIIFKAHRISRKRTYLGSVVSDVFKAKRAVFRTSPRSNLYILNVYIKYFVRPRKTLWNSALPRIS